MRIKILRTVGKRDTIPPGADNPKSKQLPAKPDGSMYQEGEVADFSKEDAERFIRTGMGEETTAPVGPAPAPAVPGVTPMPVTIVEAPKPAAEPKHHRTEPPENPPGNKDTREKKS